MRTSHEEVRKLDRKKIKSSLRLHIRLKLAEALPTTPMSIVQRPTCLDLATLPCHGTHQTGMPLVRGELPEHSGMLVWWVPWYGSVARSRQVGRCTMDIGVAGSASASLNRACRRSKIVFSHLMSLSTSSCGRMRVFGGLSAAEILFSGPEM